MAANEYHFVTRWRVRGAIEEVAEVLRDAASLSRWWPSVYLDVRVVEPGDAEGLGKVVELYTKGWLPYTLRWRFRVTESRFPETFALEASGDFEGRGRWTFEQDGEHVNVTYDWRVRADKPILRALSFVLKPVFSANHLWAMRRGEESLKLELERRRAATPETAALVPPPPGPTFPHRKAVKA
ncbi:MAG TPA: SRPBCC family protein [Pyrinomonadaceae bacterium]|nr:SRPBCC family protein [Pyrinomonadaceae bacterium]